MRTVRLYVDQPLRAGEELALNESQSHYLCRVLRLKPGQRLELFNGGEHCHPATLVRADRRQAVLAVEAGLPCERESPLQTTLVQAVARGERMDYALQKATELGVHGIELLWTERCEVKLEGKRLDNRLRHWRDVVLNAAQQSGRCRLPELRPPVALEDWLTARSRRALALLLHPQAAATLTSLKNELARQPPVQILTGPEGGFSDAEVARLQAAGARPLRFGPRTLRTETAGPAMLAALQVLAGDMG